MDNKYYRQELTWVQVTAVFLLLTSILNCHLKVKKTSVQKALWQKNTKDIVGIFKHRYQYAKEYEKVPTSSTLKCGRKYQIIPEMTIMQDRVSQES